MRWSTLLLDNASLSDLTKVPTRDILVHADVLAARRTTPRELYRRWETQQWAAERVELGPDHDDWANRLGDRAKAWLTELIHTFIVGEYTGLDLLAPIMAGAPDEDSMVFLASQAADEARHTRLMLRIGEEVLGLDPDPRRMVGQSWSALTPTNRRLSGIEARLVGDLLARPSHYATWVRAVTHFHLVTEGALAVTGQINLIRLIRQKDSLSGIEAGFVAMTRDESRHVSFGLHALRTAILEGHRDDVQEVLEEVVPVAVRVDQVDNPTAVQERRFRAGARQYLRRLDRAMRRIGLDDGFVDHVVARAAPDSAAHR
ncbi:hypothetical protein DQ384_15415 [Sphaerisporangium album]|uniref:Uncharacterized protein n=1 Tax=Sphaerisporangium album TaxID=509200 RepID=A0A367FJW6_9ACTN|nr:ribonucleotide-diphosphate reductase subunit beta [Sphaerisporangium album]RCG30666.1 hypothetical protein DQ384_15415 [Sphaerisporangium album]